MNNIFNYQFTDFNLLMKRLDKLEEKAELLNEKGLSTEITIKKSIHEYWNLKLEIYNGKKNTEEASVFSQRVG